MAGPERRAGMEDLAFLLQLRERRPDGIIVDLRGVDVVQLKDVDPVGLQALERLIHREPEKLRGEVLGDLTLPLALFTVVVEVVANFGGNHDLIALVGKRLRNQLFTPAVAVGVGCVVEVDAQIESLAHQRDGFVVGELAPPPGGDRPQTKTHL